MAEKLTKRDKKENLLLDDITLDIELEGHILAKKEKVVDNHFMGLMTELLKWEKNAPEVEISKSR